MQIGGLDNTVIKTPNGVPYIPGSSLKGKCVPLVKKISDSKMNMTIPLKFKCFSVTREETETSQKYPGKRTTNFTLIFRDAYLNETKFQETLKKAL